MTTARSAVPLGSESLILQQEDDSCLTLARPVLPCFIFLRLLQRN